MVIGATMNIVTTRVHHLGNLHKLLSYCCDTVNYYSRGGVNYYSNNTVYFYSNDKTWSSVSYSSLSKTFALASLESHKYRSSVLCFLPSKIVFIEVNFVSKKILGLQIFWGWTKFCVQKNFRLEKF